MRICCKENLEIIPLNNAGMTSAFMKKLGYIICDTNLIYGKEIAHYKYFRDYDINNYIMCYIYVKDENDKYNETLYNIYHEEYYKYYEKNPDIKILVWSNNADWCKINFKFFNTLYYRL
jgi:hypothetical protein